MNTFQCYRIFGDRTDRTSVCNFLDGKRNTLVFDLDKYLPPCCTGEKPFHKLWLIAEARDIAIMPPACVLTVFCCQVYSLYAHSYLGAFSADYHVESLVGRLWRLGMMCFFPVVTGKPLNQAPPPLWWNSNGRGFGQDYAQNKMKDLSDRADIGFCDMNFKQCRGRDVAMDMSVVGFVLNFLNKKAMNF